MLKKWSSSAPGKVIIFGEFAVLYGLPALACPVSRHVTAEWSYDSNQEPSLIIGTHTYSWQQVQDHANALKRRHQDYIKGLSPLSAVRQHENDLVFASLAHCPKEMMQGQLGVQIRSTLLEGCGQGSSAALIVCLLKGLGLSEKVIAAVAKDIEDYQHGSSSGLDTSIALSEKALWYQNSSRHFFQGQLPPLWLINTGKPASSTACSVELAKKNMTTDLLASYPHESIIRALSSGQQQDWQTALRKSQCWLQSLGVVPQEVADFVSQAEALGGSVKISGAGAVHGKQAGVAIAWLHPELRYLIKERGYTLIKESFAWSTVEQLMGQ